jgi:SAM-dependent methyltransferase
VFNLFGRRKPLDGPFVRFSGLNDDEWLALLIRSVTEPVIDGVRMPGFPDDVLQKNTVGSAGEHALREAFTFFSFVKKHARQLGRPVNGKTRVLDFGCAWGRILRCFLKDCHAANLQGVDVDPLLIEASRSSFPYCRFDQVNPLPPTSFADGSFDLITAYSVFSHLAEHASLAWVKEFSRLLSPGGIMAVTTQRRDFIDYCQSLRGKEHEFGWHRVLANAFVDADAAFAAYDAGEYLYAPTGGGPSRPSDFYGEALIPEAYVRQRWSTCLRFVEFVDDRTAMPQALIIMQKA